MFEYQVIRSKRKSISIKITADATILVKVPDSISVYSINKALQSKEQWINEHLAAMQQSRAQRAAFALDYGDTVQYCGQEYRLVSRAGNRIGRDEDSFFLPEDLKSDEIIDGVVQIYKLLAKGLLAQRVRYYADIMLLNPMAVKVSSAKTRWGSCSGKNSLNFSWRLVLADQSVIDYVVVHELAHIVHHNHSIDFWNLVADICPHYKESEEGLIALQRQLSHQDWD